MKLYHKMKRLIRKYNSIFFYKRHPASKRKKVSLSDKKRTELMRSNSSLFNHSLKLQDLIENNLSNVSRSNSLLESNGILIIENYIDHKTAIKAGAEFIDFIAKRNIRERLEEVDYFETEDLLAQNGTVKLNGYLRYSQYPKSVLTVRRKDKTEVDGGMIDVFGFNKKIIDDYPNLSKCYARISEAFIQNLISTVAGKSIRQQQLNIYLNESVTNTRGWHIDSLFDSFKVFVYLTDCEQISQGPYGYVPGSQINRKAIKQNIKNNLDYKDPYSHEDMLIPENLGIPILAKAGTLVISVQNGIHRGYEQSEGNKRIAMVDSYY